MKKVFPLLFTIILLLAFNPLFAQSFTFEPAKPIPGEKVTIKYNPVGTPLERSDKFEVICYEFVEDEIKATEVYLNLKGNAYVGAISVSEQTSVISVSFSADDKKDNNKGLGYGFMIYQKDRKTPQAGAFANMSSAFGKYYRTIGIERDYVKALNYLEKEYSMFPDLKKEGKYLDKYSYYASKAKDETVIAECKEMIETMRMQVDGEEDMKIISALYLNTGDKESAKAIDEKILAEYPNGKLAQSKMITSFYRAQSLDDKLEIYNNIKTNFGDAEAVLSSMDRINGGLAVEYGKLNDWENFNKYFAMVNSPVGKASNLNSLAWKMSGESLDVKPELAAKGRELSKESLAFIESAIQSGAAKPSSRTKNQWKNQLEYTYGMYADTYALCAYHDGDVKDALKYQSIACETNNFSDGEMDERYCVFMEKAEGAEVVEKELQRLISLGVATAKMKEQYQRVYMENNTLETALEKNMAFLKSMSDDKKMKELKDKMINDKAPDFSLVNLKGEKVALNDLKGKVVVLDFWATWCGPCKASFPGMQTAVEKYQNDDDVVFLFLDTWERVKNKEENAQKFIADKGYTFNVLLDNDNEVVAKFKVGGIPTKFVVDKNGKIRFKSVGFSGNNGELVNELSMMIEMANEASSKEKTMP